jgi:hypothetical protein
MGKHGLEQRAAIFLKAAELIAGHTEQNNAATMIANQKCSSGRN